jgi:prepilin-type N-terminal cleavage/methylation domain-containing protein
MSQRRGVTLLEMVLAISLLVMLSSMTYVFYSSSIGAREQGLQEARKLRLARMVLDRLAEEIRQSASVTQDYGVGIIGDAEGIVLTTRRVPRRELARAEFMTNDELIPEYDVVQVQYKIARHPDIVSEEGWEEPLGLARVETRIPRPERPLQEGEEVTPLEEQEQLPEGAGLSDAFVEEMFDTEELESGDAGMGPDINWEELYSQDIHYIRFCYYDGYTWWDRWNVTGENPLPQIIQVTIGFNDHPPLNDEKGQDKDNEEFCECLNKDPVDCIPLGDGEYSASVRVTQADPLFRSRVSREGQALVEEMMQEDEGEEGEEGGQ